MQFRNTLAFTLLIFAALAGASLAAQSAPTVAVSGSPGGFVYVSTNQASGNSVVQFQRALNGQLTRTAQALTQGAGSGMTKDPLASQDSLVLTGDGQLLLAVNAGSNEISVLSAGPRGLQFLSKIASGGVFPNSLAINGDLVYVLNAKGTPNITGFRLASNGMLTAIPNSTRVLPGGATAAPADVRFSQDGTLLLVTETGTNQIDIFPLADSGLASDAITMPASGKKPFGMNFATRDRVLVSEAGTGSVSSYNIDDANGLQPISLSVPDTQMASCWITLTNDKSYAFVSNTASGTISSYKIDAHGDVTLLNAVAAATANVTSAPIDSAMSDDSRFLYVEESTLGKLEIFAVSNGVLTSLGSVGGLPTSTQGIAAQ
jgi:hypothetical protein